MQPCRINAEIFFVIFRKCEIIRKLIKKVQTRHINHLLTKQKQFSDTNNEEEEEHLHLLTLTPLNPRTSMCINSDKYIEHQLLLALTFFHVWKSI